MMQTFGSLSAICSNIVAQSTPEVSAKATALITDDAVILGLLLVVLAVIFKTASLKHPFWKKFYTFCPVLLLCYFIPALLGSFNIVATDKDGSKLYFVAKNYMLPTSLVLLTLSIDLKGIIGLGPKALILFLTGTVGILLGGPLAILLVSTFSPEMVAGNGPEAVWRGMATCAGSWIGGGANQAAMKEVFEVGETIFAQMITVDVLVANVWMAGLLIIAGKSRQIDAWLKADTSAIDTLKDRMSAYQAETLRIPKTADTLMVLATGFAVTALSHFLSGRIAAGCEELALTNPWIKDFNLTSTFFWLVVLATTGGVMLSFTRLKNLEGVGASRIATVFLYLLVVTIGLKMDVFAIFNNPGVFVIGGIWMLIHILLLVGVTILIRAPVFFMAVGSKANIGGAVSAPIVAAAFHPSLAPVGVLLAVLGYALGTYAAWLCGLMMQAVAPPG
ncbi:MAG: DUF819 family protein [Planctomycetota bacterium]|nr:DUF819 family protein [Planctomycetota bacterium]